MKFAVFSDVHGNVVALDRFLATVRDNVEGYICLGDVVGYGPDNDECLEIVHGLPNCVLLVGNHEEMFARGRPLHCSPLAEEFFVWSRRFFSRIDLLPQLAEYRTPTWLFVHSLRALDRWLYVYDASALVSPLAGNVCLGHTHYQTSFAAGDFAVVNCGSVGQNRAQPGQASYAIFDSQTDEIALHSTPYDLPAFQRRLEERGYPDHLQAYYRPRPETSPAS